MKPSWRSEILAVFRKELRTELRTRSGLFSSILFSVIAVTTIAFAAYGLRLDPTLGSGLLLVTLLFSATISLPRSFISEEEAGTADLLRLLSRPHAVFWGKCLFNLGQMAFTAIVLSILFVVFTNLVIKEWPIFIIGLAGACASLAIAITLCGALVAQASNRSALAGVIGIPVLLPVVALAVGALRVAFGAGFLEGGWVSCLGLYCFALLLGAAAPYLYAAVWKG